MKTVTLELYNNPKSQGEFIQRASKAMLIVADHLPSIIRYYVAHDRIEIRYFDGFERAIVFHSLQGLEQYAHSLENSTNS